MSALVKLGPFPATVRVTVTDRLPADRDGDTCAEGGSVKIRIRPGEGSWGAAVHEAVHAVQFVEQWIGGRLDDETQAYMAQAVAEAAFEELRRADGRRKLR